MQKLIGTLTLAFAVVLAAPLPSAAQAKIRIAIWDFENNSTQSYWFSQDLGKAARNGIDTAMSENETLSAKFSVVEREKLELVLKEQGLGASGALDQQSAAKVGKILGVRYILTGGIDKFAINRTGGAIGRLGVGGQVTTADATINIRLIDTTTAERLVALSADADVRKGGGFYKGTSLSRDAEWGLAEETIEKAAKAVVEKLVAGNYLAKIGPGTGVASGLEGRIAKVDGKQAWLNIGTSSGVKVGDRFLVFNVGDAIVDPDTGQSLGASEKQSGTGEVTEVAERFAVITFTGAAKVKDTVRKQQ